MVALSVAFAMFAAMVALELAGRVTSTHHRKRAAWLAAGAVALGLGIWSMHYIGMLALWLPVPVLYHYPTVACSLLLAIAASAVALFTVSGNMGLKEELAASFAMGSGIAAMHYVGMSAMRLPAMMEYNWSLIFLSVALAIAASFFALTAAFRAREDQLTYSRKASSAILLGSVIPLMHYTGMWAVSFHASAAPVDTSHAGKVSLPGIALISTATLLVLTVTMGAACLDRTMAQHKMQLGMANENLSHFTALAEAIPEIVWTATPEGMTDYANKRWYEISGMSENETMGRGWGKAIHADDLPIVARQWQEVLKSGAVLQTEYRIRNAEGEYRWYLVRATAVRDSAGAIIKWFGTCTDIEEQKHHQQILEAQIRERTEELAHTNTLLQEEMVERDLARRELDLQNERMMQELTERSQRATMLAKMGEHLQSCVTREEVLAGALGFAPKIFPAARGAVAMLNSARSLAEVLGCWAECQVPAPVFELAQCWALRTGHPHLVVSGDSTARCAHAAGVNDTYLCIPILAQGETLGILHFQATPDAPTLADAELSLKTTFAAQVGLSISNIRLREALRTQSIRDPLTGLFNRRYLDEMMERETRRAIRAEHGLGVLILDLDHFKKFNDTYGHDAGDTVLRQTAGLLEKSVRAEDIVCRFGGEEFVILLPMADLKAAQARGERIRCKIRELTVLHQGQSLGMITVSVGVAALPVHGISAKQLLEAADAALYRAKRGGRDRVVTADALSCPDAPTAPTDPHEEKEEEKDSQPSTASRVL